MSLGFFHVISCYFIYFIYFLLLLPGHIFFGPYSAACVTSPIRGFQKKMVYWPGLGLGKTTMAMWWMGIPLDECTLGGFKNGCLR